MFFVYFRKLLYILLYMIVHFCIFCILLSILEYYCQLLKIVVSYSCFTRILLHILVYLKIVVFLCVVILGKKVLASWDWKDSCALKQACPD